MEIDENEKVSLSAELLMLHLLKRLREKQLINVETYNKCVREVKADASIR